MIYISLSNKTFEYSIDISDNSKLTDFVPEYIKPERENRFIGFTSARILNEYGEESNERSKILIYPYRRVIKKTPFLFTSKSYLITLIPDKRHRKETNVYIGLSSELFKTFMKGYINVYAELLKNKEKFYKTYRHIGKEIKIDIQEIYNKSSTLSKYDLEGEDDYKYANIIKNALKFPSTSSMKEFIRLIKNTDSNSELKLQFFPELETFLALLFIEDKKLFTFLATEILYNIIRFIEYKYFKNKAIRKSYQYFPKDLTDFYQDKFMNIAEKLWFLKTKIYSRPWLFIDYIIYAYRYYISLRNTINTSIRDYAQDFYKNSMYMENLNDYAFSDDERKEKLDFVIDGSIDIEKELEIDEFISKLKEIAKKYGYDFDEILDAVNNKRKQSTPNSKYKKFINIAKKELSNLEKELDWRL